MNSSDISPRNPIKFDVSEQLLIKGIGTHLQVGLHSINIRTALQGYDKISSFPPQGDSILKVERN
ncbi:MAG: hypothetical protein ACTSVF_01240 [Candidatus Asgardarchaeia archaeon]